jgi:hypothetical protein
VPTGELLPLRRTHTVQASDDSQGIIKKFKSTSNEKILKQYSTEEKFSAVRDLTKYAGIKKASDSLGIPIGSLKRWKEKIKNHLFQAKHVESVYNDKPQKDKFFKAIDDELFKWV